jgi:CRP-like cAMP-binding protein
MSREAVPTGAVIVWQGARDGDLYLIESGQVAVRRRDSSGDEQIVATLGPGDFFGEIAFVTGEARTADVVASAPTTLLRLSRDAYATLSELATAEELGRVGAARMAMNAGATSDARRES